MSRMSRYLKQSATLELVKRGEDGKAVVDVYGQPVYDAPQPVRCRREPYVSRGSASAGPYREFSTTYYLDETIELNTNPLEASKRLIGRLDGSEIMYVNEYRDGSGALVGYEVQV